MKSNKAINVRIMKVGTNDINSTICEVMKVMTNTEITKYGYCERWRGSGTT